MDVRLAESINTFGILPNADIVPPSEESVFILTSDQLQDIIKEAIQPLQDEISDLKATVAKLQEDITALEATQDTHADNQLIQLRLIADLRKGPQPMQRDRGEILRALIVANGGKMLAKDARQKMHLSKQSFTNLLAVVDGVESRPCRTDKRQRLLVLE